MSPKLSALVVTPDNWKNMRRTLAALRAQTLAADIEVVLIGPSESALDLPFAETEGFASVVKTTFDRSAMSQALARGVLAATSEVVLLTEDHCFPMPNMAESLLRYFEDQDVVGAGPTVVNANPRSLTSWAQFLIEYGTYSQAGAKGIARQIPGHNSAYRRSTLLDYGDSLERQLNVETLMHWDLSDRGLKLVNSGSAITRHYNVSRVFAANRFTYVFSRTFAACRIEGGKAIDRIKLALLWPLIPALRLKRLWPAAVQLMGFRRAVLVLPGLIVNLWMSGLGEGLGYALKRGTSVEELFDLEFHRERFFCSSDSFPSPEDLSSELQSESALHVAIC